MMALSLQGLEGCMYLTLGWCWLLVCYHPDRLRRSFCFSRGCRFLLPGYLWMCETFWNPWLQGHNCITHWSCWKSESIYLGLSAAWINERTWIIFKWLDYRGDNILEWIFHSTSSTNVLLSFQCGAGWEYKISSVVFFKGSHKSCWSHTQKMSFRPKALSQKVLVKIIDRLTKGQRSCKRIMKYSLPFMVLQCFLRFTHVTSVVIRNIICLLVIWSYLWRDLF